MIIRVCSRLVGKPPVQEPTEIFRSALGTVGGMLIGTVALLFVVPVLFIIFQTIEEKVMPKRHIATIR